MKRVMRYFLWACIPMLTLFTLTSCDGGTFTPGNIFNHIGKTFAWFFTDYTPAYFSCTTGIWKLFEIPSQCWTEIPSFIGYICGGLLFVIIFIITVGFSVILLVFYIVSFALFIAVYVILIVLGLLGALIALISGLSLGS